MTKHTPTPWVVSSYEGGWTCIRECHGGPVLFKLSLNIEDNAERAVACTNAFHSPDGREIPTDKIEPGVVWAMRDGLQDASDKLAMFIREHEDPGADALALQYRLRALLAKLEE